MRWTIYFSNRAKKQVRKLTSEALLTTLRLLVGCLELQGPFPGKRWLNYGKLNAKKSGDKHHCHLVKGNPTYVCCWDVINKKERIIEVYYVGTHEKAPY